MPLDHIKTGDFVTYGSYRHGESRREVVRTTKTLIIVRTPSGGVETFKRSTGRPRGRTGIATPYIEALKP